MIRLIRSPGSRYLVVGPVAHKSFETGFLLLNSNDGFNASWRFRSRGDHAGLQFSVALFGLLFELNLTDSRHWNWRRNRWMSPDEESEHVPEATDDE
jgi:hypothetical protein